MKRWGSFTVLLGLLPLARSAKAQLPVTYDVAASFEQGWTTDSNPNGVWSYGYSSGLSTPITLYSQTVQNGVNGPGAQYWLSPTSDIGNSPAAEFNNGAAYSGGAGQVNFLANEFILVAGIGGQYSDLVFTAPANGVYSIASSFRGAQNGVGTVVGVVANGNTLFNSTVTAVGQIVPFNASVNLSVGNTVVFSVGPGGGVQNTGVSATISLTTVSPSPNILPQLAFGGGWYSALYLTNSNAGAVSFPVSFTSDDGTPLAVPSIGGSSTTVNLAAQGTAILEALNVGTLSQGYVIANLPAGVAGYGVFRQSVPGVPDQEAVVPLANVSSTKSTLIYDDTAYVTAVAIANPSALPVTVSVTVWNSSGAVIGTSSIFLEAGTKTEAALRNITGLSGVAGNRGVAQFTVALGSVAVLGLRFDGTAFTSIPAVQQ